jgi:carboxylesterase
MTSGEVDTFGFELHGDHVGVLLLHGFSGAPVEMRPLGEALARHGRSVLAPRMPGHGTQHQDLAGVPWEQWVEAGIEGFDRLRSTCDEVFVCGFSMGSLVGAHVCAEKPASGLVALAPALRSKAPLWAAGLARFVKPTVKNSPPEKRTHLPEGNAPIWCYDELPTSAVHELHKLMKRTPKVLPQVTCPLLVVHGRHDPVLVEEGARQYLALVDNGDKDLVWLENTGHGVPVETEREAVFQRVNQFIDRHSPD